MAVLGSLFRKLQPEKKPESSLPDPVFDDSSSTCSTTSTNRESRDHPLLRKVFTVYDANGDGKISVGELETLVCAMGNVTKESKSVVAYDLDDVTADAAAMIEAADLDGDGFLDFHEFAACAHAATGDSEQREFDRGEEDLRLAFAVYDRDGDGVITAYELLNVIRWVLPASSGTGHTIDDCKDMIKAVDKNGDGVVSFPEFKAMMKAPESTAGLTGTGLFST